MKQLLKPRLLAAALMVLSVGQAFALTQAGQSSPVHVQVGQAVKHAAAAKVQVEKAAEQVAGLVEVAPVAAEPVVTTTIVPPPVINPSATDPASPVFRDEAVNNPFPSGVRPPVIDVRTVFLAPEVRLPTDLVTFEPARQLIRELAIAKWGEAEAVVLDSLLMHESRFDPRAVQFNPDTGKGTAACGIFQALECGKMPRIDWRGQVEWGLNTYLPERYGTPSRAWTFWLSKAKPCAPSNPHGFTACGGWY